MQKARYEYKMRVCLFMSSLFGFLVLWLMAKMAADRTSRGATNADCTAMFGSIFFIKSRLGSLLEIALEMFRPQIPHLLLDFIPSAKQKSSTSDGI